MLPGLLTKSRIRRPCFLSVAAVVPECHAEEFVFTLMPCGPAYDLVASRLESESLAEYFIEVSDEEQWND